MKTKKNFASKALSIFLCLLLTLSTVLVAGIATTSAGAEEGIYLRGNMNGWNCYEQYKFVDEGNGIYTLVLDMTGGNYEFKIATPTWSVSIGNEKNDNDNAHLVIEADSIIKFTANTKTRDYTAESMNTKSDFTLGASAQTIEAEQYTYALGAVSVWDEAKASAGKYVGAFDKGDSLNYGVTVSGNKAQTYKFEISVASETDNGAFDFTAGEEVFPVSFTSTGAWQTYKTVVVTKTLNPGYNRLTIQNVGGTYNVDKITVTPVSAADAVAKGETTLDFKGFDAASDAALIKNGVFTNAGEGEYVSLIVKPELDGVYTVTLDSENARIIVNGMKYENGDSVVLEGETELLVFANEANATVSKVSFKYINNIEQVGYLIRDGKTTGYRFANTFAIDKIVITAPAVDGEENDSKVILSNGKVIDTTDMYKDGAVTLEFETAENIAWFVYEASNASQAYINVFGTKVMDSATDIALDGYVSTAYGWLQAAECPYSTNTATEGKLGFGFDKEVTVEKIVVVGVDESIPAKATLTTADDKKVELTGTKVGNDVVFEIEDAYSFGFYLDFGQKVNYAAVQVYGDKAYKGGITNVSGIQDYSLYANGLTEDDSRVIANTGEHIITSETGSDREWYYNSEIIGEDVPMFYAPNTPLAEAAYNLTMEEIFKSINYDETFGDVFYTGTNWHKVWTRDTAISMQYILSWMFPEISTNCANAKVVGKDGNLTFEEDTGTGGSYPVSTDRIIMMLAVWETYLADGNLETLEYFYEVASNTIEQDYTVVYDKEAGLFRGETCGLDHRDKTYGDWTGEDDQNGIVTIAEGKAASTNIIYCQAMKILAEAAEILDKEDEAVAWAELAADLEDAIAKRLWHDELGTYSSWEYPDWMGSPLAYKQDVLANGYAVWYNIGGQEKSDSIMENHTLVNFGANTVYPQKNAARWTGYKYHDSGVWPGWEALLMIGAVNNANENNLLAEEIWNSCIRGAVACLTNYEVIDYETGEGLHSTQQLWSVAATMAGYYRVLFGMEYTTEGITFDPYVPEWMEGPFYAGNYKYRDAVLELELIGKGDTVAEMYVNGEKVANDYVLPTTAQGEYSIKIVLSDSGAEDKINLKDENTAKAPNAPSRVTLASGKLSWSAVAGCTYKVWTGTEYVDVEGTSYTIDTTKYGVYSVIAVDKTTGLWSELSAPKEYNPTGTKVTVNANNYYDKAPSTGNTNVGDKKTVYFTNNKGWDKVNIFFWGGSSSTGWPGEAMTWVGKNDGGEDVYCYSISTDTANIIFNNGSEQTVDITTGVEDNAGFYLDKKTDKWTVGTWKNETFKPADSAGAAGGFTAKVTIPSDGVYQLSVIHSNQGDPTAGITAAIRSVYIDGEDVGSLVFPAMSYTKQVSSHLRLELTKGEHEITIKYDTDNWYDRNMSQAHGDVNNNVTYHTIQFARTGDIGETPVVPPVKTYPLGDANGDESVNVKDATSIQKHVAGLITLAEGSIKPADVDGNAQVNVKDATAIQKHIAGIETGFEIGKVVNK